MDLGLSRRKAIVCASTAGLGLACAVALAEEGRPSSSTAGTRNAFARQQSWSGQWHGA